MKILFVTTSYPVSEDDPRGNHVRILARQLAADGDDITVVAPARKGAPLQDELEGVQIRRFRYWPGGGTLATNVAGIVPSIKERPLRAIQVPGFLFSMARAATAAAATADVIHAHWIYPSGWAALRAARKHAKPVVATSHGGDVSAARHNRLLRSLTRWTLRRVDRATAVSDALAAELTSLAGGLNVTCTPLGVEPRPDETAAHQRPPSFLFVGSLIERKGIDILLDAFDRIPPDDAELVVVGDGPLSGLLIERASGNSAIRILGALPPSQVVDEMKASSCLVLPSRSEGRPVVILEAMAHGLPVIATDIPGSRELVVNGATGVLCNPTADSLADAVAALAADSDLRRQMGATGKRQLVERELTSSAAAARFRSIYQTAAGSSA